MKYYAFIIFSFFLIINTEAVVLLRLTPQNDGRIRIESTGETPDLITSVDSFISQVTLINALADPLDPQNSSFISVTGNLSASGSSEIINTMTIPNDGLDTPSSDITFFSLLGSETAAFQASEVSFTGIGFIDDLNGELPVDFAVNLLTNGFGDIIAGDSGPIIGQFEVILPEPSSCLLLALGSCALLFRRRH